MQVEIRLLGTASAWKLEGPRIRIGRDPGCDVPLSPDRFPMVSREHLVLVLDQGHVRFTDPGSANGTYVNGVRASQGRLLNTDRVRLGSDGPELEISFSDVGMSREGQDSADATVLSTPVSLHTPTMASAADAVTTMMLGGDGSLQKNPVSPAAQPTTVAPALAAAAMPQAAASPPRAAEATRVAPAASGSTAVAPASPPPMQGPTIVQHPGMQVPMQMPAAPSPAQYAQTEESLANNESTLSKEQEEMIEQRVSSLQKLVYLLAAMVLVLLGLVVYLQQQLQKTHDAVNQLSQNAQNAVAQYTPQLQSQINNMNEQMASMDGKMQKAQDQMVQRLNADVPVILDKYFDKKMKQMQDSGQLQQLQQLQQQHEQ